MRVDRFNNQGKRHGIQAGWFNDGKPQLSIEYLDGYPSGKVKEWYPDGSPMLDYRVRTAANGTVELLEGTAYSEKGKAFTFNVSEGKDPKKQMTEIEALSYYKRFVQGSN